MTWPLPQNSVYNNEPGHLNDHDNIYACLNSGRTGVPVVVTLTDASTVAVNAALGSDFRLTLTSAIGSTRIIGTPSNGTDGQRISLTVVQDSAGGRAATWSSAWGFPVNGTPILSTAPYFADVLEFTYNASIGLWLFLRAQYGFTTTSTIFADDFGSVPSGSLPSAANWCIQSCGYEDDPTGGSMNYRDDVSNVYVNGSGQLVMAVTTSSGGSTTTPAQGAYCSARISTFQDGLLNGAASWVRPGFRPTVAGWGTITFSIASMTTATGFWPALWVYGASANAPDPASWPAHGEIDLLENFGGAKGDLSHAYGDIIGPGLPGTSATAWGNGYASVTALESPAGINVADGNPHVLKLVIPQNGSQISMSCDGTAYIGSPVTKTAWLAAASSAGYPDAVWPFDKAGSQLGILVNVATGGPTAVVSGLGYPSGGQTFPVEVLVIDSITWTQP